MIIFANPQLLCIQFQVVEEQVVLVIFDDELVWVNAEFCAGVHAKGAISAVLGQIPLRVLVKRSFLVC